MLAGQLLQTPSAPNLDSGAALAIVAMSVSVCVSAFSVWVWWRSRAARDRVEQLMRRNRELDDELLEVRGHRTRSRELRNLLQAVTDGCPDAIYVKDLAGRYLFINPAGARSLQLSVDEIIGEHPRELVDHESALNIVETDREVIATGQSIARQTVVNFGGEARVYFMIKGPYLDQSGDIRGVFGIARDVTQQHTVESERSALKTQLQHAQKMEAVGTLAGGIAHDFNNLLTGILGEVELLLRDSGRSDSTNGLRSIQEIVVRASELTRQLLGISRRQTPTFKRTDLNRTVQRATRLLRRAIRSSIVVDLELDPGLPKVRADGMQLEQALLNLGINARDSLEEHGGGRIEFAIRRIQLRRDRLPAHARARSGDFVLITVKDDGCGIAESDLPRIFEPFYSTKAPERGTGLGLAMVYSCVVNHEGWINVHSQIGRGTCFEVFLPLDESAELEESPLAIGDEDLPRGEETVLVVDDADTVLYIARDVLEVCGYHVLTAWDGDEALQVFREHAGEIDLVITDLVMPRAGGRALLRELRAIGWNRPVLLASGHGLYADESDVRAEGFHALVTKPYQARELAVAARNALDDVEHAVQHDGDSIGGGRFDEANDLRRLGRRLRTPPAVDDANVHDD